MKSLCYWTQESVLLAFVVVASNFFFFQIVLVGKEISCSHKYRRTTQYNLKTSTTLQSFSNFHCILKYLLFSLMSKFFKSFTNKYSPLSQNDNEDGAPLPPPVTQPGAAPSNQSFKTKLQQLNPFRSQSVYLEDDENYVTSDPGMFELLRWDRMLIFALCFAGSVCCYLICIFLFPILSLKPRKFALIWSIGSILFLVSFGVLQGFKAYMIHLFLSTRIIFTIVFGASIILTLISSVSLKSTLLSIIFAVIQLLAALWYTVSYFPLGKQTLNLAGNVARSQVDTWISS